MDPLDVSPDNIWQYAQNRPSLICQDLEEWVPQEVTAKVLMARGVYKWLAVRRELILLKNEWKDELTRLYRVIENREVKRNSSEHHRIIDEMPKCLVEVSDGD